MAEEIFRDPDFKHLMEEHVRSIIEYMTGKNQPFSILCNIALVDFDPPLPAGISETFKPLTLFVLAGYTFETVSCDEENIYFEAGFGAENFASNVTIPLFAILQVVVDEIVVMVNLTAGTEEFKTRKEQEKGVENSMQALLSNPENQRFVKKKR